MLHWLNHWFSLPRFHHVFILHIQTLLFSDAYDSWFLTFFNSDSHMRMYSIYVSELHFDLFVRSFVHLQFKRKMFLFPFIHCDWNIFSLNNRIIFAQTCLFYSTWYWIMRKLLVFFFLSSSQAWSPAIHWNILYAQLLFGNLSLPKMFHITTNTFIKYVMSKHEKWL